MKNNNFFKFIFSPAASIDLAIFNNIKDLSGQNLRTLDFGCGNCKFSKIISKSSDYYGLDIEDRRLIKSGSVNHKVYDGQAIPYENSEFKQVLAVDVFEHIKNIEKTLLEINRVLEIGGQLIVSVPFIWIEHEEPNDYRRYTSRGLILKLENFGFKSIEARKIGKYAIEINLIIKYRYLASRMVGKNLSYILFAPFIIAINLLNHNSSSENNYYSNSIVKTIKVKNIKN